MAREDQAFLRRWSRLKREASATPVPSAKNDGSPAPAELPPLESLSFESDFRVFMRAKVDEGVRRAALKKLFSDPRFNIMDGLDVYIDDYSKEDPIPPGMLAQLQHARTTLFGAQSEQQAPPEVASLAEVKPAAVPTTEEPDAGALLTNQTASGACP
jgi:hypothetical protein